MAQLELDHHQLTDQNHPALSAVPTPPGPELDPKNHDQNNLPSPPLFSPPTYDHATFPDEDTQHHPDHSLDMSLSHSSNLTNELDLTSQNNSTRGSIEPHTPEPVAPNLSFINFVTGQTPSLSFDKLGERDEKKVTTNTTTEEVVEEEADETFDRSSDVEQAEHHDDDQVSVHPPEDQKHSSAEHPQTEEPQVDQEDQKPQVDEKKPLESETLPPTQSTKSAPQEDSVSTETWVDIAKPEFQVAIGLFAVPWSTMIIFLRLINQVAILAFSQPVLSPISGLFTSIIAPSLLYSSLLTLFITSFEYLA